MLPLLIVALLLDIGTRWKVLYTVFRGFWVDE